MLNSQTSCADICVFFGLVVMDIVTLLALFLTMILELINLASSDKMYKV